jgi:eukaryotic-like serine/threonine-protein kinase
MVPDDWELIKRIFTGALAVAPDLRDAYVVAQCGGRTEIQSAVTELVAAHSEASSTFLEPAGLLFDAPLLLRAGDRVANRFEILRAIARGAMGEVYEARDDRLQLRVALKTLRPQLVGDAHTAERFRREVLVTRDIAHENLCRIFDLIEHPVGAGTPLKEGTVIPCLTMQLLEGQSLQEYVAQHRPMRDSEVLPILEQVAAALDVLHDNGVVHRDLKPSNVVLVTRGDERRAMLTDFGLAKPLDESLFETQKSVQAGAPFFMAPELFKGERPSRASDVYAFGLLIDEMVTRDRAFSADSLHGLMLEKLQAPPSRPSERGATLPPGWDEVVHRCVALEPGERFARATDVCRALGAPPQPTSVMRRPLIVRQRARPWKLAAMSGAALAALVALLLVTIRPVLADSPQSVIVQPFENLTGDKANDYLSVGAAGELGRRLSRVPGLSVYTPRNNAKVDDPSQEALFALSGHVQQTGSTLRITAQLTDRKEMKVVWSQRYEGPREQSLRMEDELADDAAGELAQQALRRRSGPVSWLPFIRPAAPEVPAGGTTSNEAFDLYMRARYLFESRTLPEALAAVPLLQRATQIDPQFAAPYATLADLQQLLMDLHYAPHDELLRKAETYAERAVALDPNLPDAQLSLASIRQIQSRWDEADAGFEKTLQLHPTFARAHRWYGGMLLQFGRYDAALQQVEQAMQLDPYDTSGQSFYGLALFYANRPEDAAKCLERLVARGDLLHPHMILGQVYSFLARRPGRTRDEYVRKALEQSAILQGKELAAAAVLPAGSGPPRTEFADFVGALAWSSASSLEKAQPFLDRLEAERAAGRTSPSILARVYASQSRVEDTLRALEDSEAQHDRELMYLSVSPWYRHIRSEPRFEALVKRMRLDR